MSSENKNPGDISSLIRKLQLIRQGLLNDPDQLAAHNELDDVEKKQPEPGEPCTRRTRKRKKRKRVEEGRNHAEEIGNFLSNISTSLSMFTSSLQGRNKKMAGKDRKMFQRWRKKKRRKKRKRKRILSVISQGLEARLENLGENPSRKQLKKLFDPRQ